MSPGSSGASVAIEPRRIVGVGASAGGLEALERFFGPMPTETGMAFVVVQHLSAEFESMMDTLLARRTAIPICTTRDGEPVRPDTIYLMPPGKEMTLSGGRLMLTERDPRQGLALPIDRFFRSLADDGGDRAVAIVLSGSGSDGARGVRAVKKAGGLVLAQGSHSAAFDGMPSSARASGCVDFVGTPAEMGEYLIRHDSNEPRPSDAHRRDRASGEADERAPEDAESTDAIFEILRNESDLDFSLYKPATVGRRIERRLSLARVPDIESYVRLLREDADERRELYQDLLIGVTRFFRDPDTFAFLEHEVIPDVIRRVPPSEPIRVWVPACATGEEAYSIAILLYERLHQIGRTPRVKIFATDVHRESLAIASMGVYDADRLADLSPSRLERYFVRHDAGYQVSSDLRHSIVFAPHDILTDPPFTRLDLVSCRNLLIYFQPGAQQRAVSLFHFGLKAGGTLVLGSSESPGPLSEEFDTLDDAQRVYRKRRDVRLAPDLRPIAGRGQRARDALRTRARNPGVPPPRTDVPLPLESYDALLDRFMPPSLLVTEGRQLVDSFGGAHRFLGTHPRRPSSDALDLLRSDAKVALSGGLMRVRETGQPVRFEGISVGTEDGVVTCDVSVEPVRTRSNGLQHYLISFASKTDEPAPEPTPRTWRPTDLPEIANEHIQSLEDELGYTRENLQATIEELETSNEELQATNEELVASNEELQSTNEELHSVNEELFTVNHEYQKKIEELEVASRDMSHLLESTEVATIFLDESLCIRKLTPRASSLFDVVPQDIGRRLSSFSHHLRTETLLDDLARCVETATVVEQEVRGRDGSSWFVRMLPYRVGDHHEGVVLTLVDIGSLVRARSELERLSAIVESSDDAIFAKNLDGVITSWNGGAERLYGWKADEIVGRSVETLVPADRTDELREILRQICRGEPLDHMETKRVRKDGTPVYVSVSISPVHDSDGTLVGASAIARDITARVETARRLQESERRYQDLYENSPDMYLQLDVASGRILDCNRTTTGKLGYAREDLIGRSVLTIYTPESREEAERTVARIARTGSVRDAELRVRRSDGSVIDVVLNATTSRDAAGQPDRVRAVWQDITQRRCAEQRLHDEIERRERFLAMLSHELRNPMNALQTASTILVDSGEGAERSRALQVIHRQARQMGRLLDDLLDVARITQDKIELRRTAVDLWTVCRDAIDAIEPTFAERNIEIALGLSEPAPTVHGDPARLQQVVVNLLSNAGKFSARGSRVAVMGRRERGHAQIRVVDQGAGIPSEMLDRIFEPFLQLDAADAPAGGMGLGLTLVRSLVDLHGGVVRAESRGIGKGAVFTVELPLVEGQVSEVHKRPSTDPVGAGLRVVVVEDMEDARASFQALLKMRGCDVRSAPDCRSGIELIACERPDIAFVDIGLPDSPGYEVARGARQNGELRKTKLIALTGYGQARDVTRALEAGFDDHMIKPVDIEEVGRLLAECAERRERSRESSLEVDVEPE